MYKIYDGDLFLYAVDTRYEADEHRQLGVRIVVSWLVVFSFSWALVSSGPGFTTDTLKKVSVFFDFLQAMLYN